MQHFKPDVLPGARLDVLGPMGNIVTESSHTLLPQGTRDELVVCPSLSDLNKTRGTIVAADKRLEVRALARIIAPSFLGKIWFECAPRRIRVVVGHVRGECLVEVQARPKHICEILYVCIAKRAGWVHRVEVVL
jgi:hypothetical protein